MDAWADHELGVAGAGGGAAGQPERVGGRHGQRPDLVAATTPRGDAVRGAGGRPARERRHEEPGRAATFVEPVGGGEQGGGVGAEVLDQEVDASLGTDMEAVGPHAAADRELGAARAAEPEHTRPISARAATPTTSISRAPSRKLPTTSPSAAPVSDQPRRVRVTRRPHAP